MAWSGGNFTRANPTWATDASLGIGIEAGRHDAQDNDFTTGINNCLTKDGQNTPTANLPMGGYKHTSVANAAARTDYAATGQVQDGDFIWLGTTGGTATAMTASATPAITAYKDGQKFRMKPAFASTGTSYTSHTLNVNGLGTKAIIHQDGQSPTLGSWQTGTATVLEMVYNAGYFVITSAPIYYQSWTPTITPSAGSASAVNIYGARFTRIDSTIHFAFSIGYNQNTASATYVDVTLPVRPASTAFYFNGGIVPNVNVVASWAQIVSAVAPGTVRCYAYDQQSLLTGTAKLVAISGCYEIG